MSRITPLFSALARRTGINWQSAARENSAGSATTLQANFAAIVLNGLFFPTAGKILGAGLLLTWFLNELTPSAFVVALLIPIQYGAALLAQPWIGQWMSTRPTRAPYYRNQALVRAAVWVALGVVVMFARENAAVLLAAFFIVVVIDAVAAGVGNIAFSDTLARVIPKSLRGRARGGRGMAGAIVAGTAGILINRLVSPGSGLGVFAWLFAVAGICYGIGGLIVGAIGEPKTNASRAARTSSESLGTRVREMLAAAGYRRFLAVQTLLIPATMGLTFFSLFGRREFNLDLKAFGVLIVSDALAPLVGNWFWGRHADRVGNPRVLRASALVSLVAPALALAAGFAGESWSHGMTLAAFGVIVFALGIAATGVELASKNFILDLAPDERRRPVYIGVNDTLIAVPTMLLVIGGAVIDWVGFPPVFVAIAACSMAAAILARDGRSRRNVA